MSIYAIGDLHLSFGNNKPMDIFGDNWKNHETKIKKDWIKKVKEDDTVILVGDFSWALDIKDTLLDFEYLNKLPGKKIFLKGNHDYWWGTITSMKKFLKEHNFENIEFIYNTSVEVENKIFCGTRGWSVNYLDEVEKNDRIVARECNRLELSIQDALKKNIDNKELIVCLHYPPIAEQNIQKNKTTPFMEILKKYNIKKCYYGHLHGESIQDAIQGNIEGIELKLVSCDSCNFELIKIN